MVVENLRIDVTPGGVPLVIHVSQYDAGLRQFNFTPYDKGVQMAKISGATVTVEATKPDGYAVQHPCTYNNDGTITYVLQEQLAACEGQVWSKLTWRGSNGDILGAKAIIWAVDTAGIEDGAIASESELPLIEQAAEFAQTYDEKLGEAVASIHVIPGQVVIDGTLTVPGAAADAQATGQAIHEVRDALEAEKVDKPVIDGEVSNGIPGQVLATDGEGGTFWADVATSRKVNQPIRNGVIDNGTSGQVLRTLGNGKTEWVTPGTPTDAQTEAAINAWLDAHPEATTTVEDGSITIAKLSADLRNVIENGGQFATPQEYGAVGDGVADDTDAINLCLANNQLVLIPAGYYRITAPITTLSKIRSTVFCSDKAMFIADATAFNQEIQGAATVDERPAMLILQKLDGWNALSVTWFGGVFNCNNVSGLIGVKINQTVGAFGYIPKLDITNIGENGIGLFINASSSKLYFGQLYITGTDFIVDPSTGDWTTSYNLAKTTTGFYAKNAYDFSIATLDINACTVGIYSEGGTEVYCTHYHYWSGLDSADTMTYAQFVKTRAFHAVTGFWTFGLFYDDQSYIGAECRAIVCASSVHVCPSAANITGATGDIISYSLKALNNAGGYDFGKMRVAKRDTVYGGVFTNGTFYAMMARNAIRADVLYRGTFPDVNGTLFSNYLNKAITVETEYVVNQYYVLGYMCDSMDGIAHITISRHAGRLVSEFDAVFLRQQRGVRNAVAYEADGALYFAFSNDAGRVTINGLTWRPLLVRSAVAYGWDVTMVSATGNIPILAPSELLYNGGVVGETQATVVS